MWAIATLVFYLFYRFAIVWYLSFWMMSRPSARPPAWQYWRFHCGVLVISGALLTGSAYLYFLSNPWLALAPIPLMALSLVVFLMKRRNRLNSVISKAVDIQIRMEQHGEPQAKINQAIYLEVTGYDLGAGIDGNLKSFVKYGVLRELGLYKQTSNIVSRDLASDLIDAKIDALYSARKPIEQ
jgi:hypothetical protein